ncbi:MAG: helicase-associated domain-containing protein [Planctomycetota bacterium]|nr:helicase-associated domain-containing protein [Planctomycetota bacterium]
MSRGEIDRADAGAYGEALRRYATPWLRAVWSRLEPADAPLPEGVERLSSLIASRIQSRLEQPGWDEALTADERTTLRLLTMFERSECLAAGFAHTLRCVGIDPDVVLTALTERGMAAVSIGVLIGRDAPPWEVWRRPGARLAGHPGATGRLTRALPMQTCELINAPAGGREADGLEPFLRIASLWQRLADAPARVTRQGLLFKRDRERIEDDPVLASAIADNFEPLPDMPALWLELGRRLGLIDFEPDAERIDAAPAEAWSGSAESWSRRLASAWLTLDVWHEVGGIRREDAETTLAFPYARPAILLAFATLPKDEWTSIEHLAEWLQANHPGWNALTLEESERAARRIDEDGEPASNDATAPSNLEALRGFLLGVLYQSGLAQVAVEPFAGTACMRLSSAGRAFVEGGTATPRECPDKFMWIQPNLDVIAYRQGLEPELIGRLSRFLDWTHLGAALQMKLTKTSVERGIDGGLTAASMIEALERHASREVPSGAIEAIRGWSRRRERVTLYLSSTLVEFADAAERDRALAAWPAIEGEAAPRIVGERLLLVERASDIPFALFRLAGSRDYRRPSERCCEVGPDGVSITIDLSLSDLLVEAELARLADEAGDASGLSPGGGSSRVGGRRRFEITPRSIARALEAGWTSTTIEHWFERRAGTPIPPAVALLIEGNRPGRRACTVERTLIVRTRSAEILDGLFQHPRTRPYFGERLGPVVAVVVESVLPGLRVEMSALGLDLDAGELDDHNGAAETAPRDEPESRNH